MKKMIRVSCLLSEKNWDLVQGTPVWNCWRRHVWFGKFFKCWILWCDFEDYIPFTAQNRKVKYWGICSKTIQIQKWEINVGNWFGFKWIVLIPAHECKDASSTLVVINWPGFLWWLLGKSITLCQENTYLLKQLFWYNFQKLILLLCPDKSKWKKLLFKCSSIKLTINISNIILTGSCAFSSSISLKINKIN